MQVQPPRAHTFSGGSGYASSSSYSSVTTAAYSPHSSNPTLTPSTTRTSSASRFRNRIYTAPPEPIDEGFFSTPSSPFSPSVAVSTATASPTFSSPQMSTTKGSGGEKGGIQHIHASQAKAKIKPLWKLATGNARTSGGSLDLSQPGGGEAARNLGLGIYGSGEYMYGYDEMDPVPRHRRTTSNNSGGNGGYTKTGQYIHPRRQVPRPYTPNQGSDGHESSDDEGGNASRGYYSGEYSRGNSLDYARRGGSVSGGIGVVGVSAVSSSALPPSLRLRTDSALSSPMLRTATGASHSPNTPVASSGAHSLLLRPSARQQHSVSGATTREPSPSFAASVTAARLAWDAKEAHKEEKREKKRRKSEQREREKAESRTSKDISRAESNHLHQHTSIGSTWTEEQGEKVLDYSYNAPPPPPLPPVIDIYTTTSRITPAVTTTATTSTGGKRWGGGGATAWTPPKRKGPGLKKRWLGFVVWIRIGLVKMGRKFGGGGAKKRKS
ncbi:hypothetical protein DFH27DRAFT_332185 [Peziza echinospora]|nr:hypothetical protein DFH27DRAFT_332185 [Peziza echinospora]